MVYALGLPKGRKERDYPVTSTVVEGEGHTNRLNQEMPPKVLEEFIGKKKKKDY